MVTPVQMRDPCQSRMVWPSEATFTMNPLPLPSGESTMEMAIGLLR